ncbi:MAG: hypothetical protein IPK83_23435 [Planctomycetes bacterium]|nr:hypothetical protein [Planctomycetota bacterium]
MERVTCKCGHTWMLGGGGRNVVCSQCGRPQGDGAQGAENKPAEATTIAGLTMIDPREPPEIDSAALADVERTGESAPRATSETAGDELVTPGMHAGARHLSLSCGKS